MKRFGDPGQNSALYWWPIIKDTPILTPKTVVIPVNGRTLAEFMTGVATKEAGDFFAAVFGAVNEVGLPAFIRTDHFSGKHQFKETCFVDSPSRLRANLYRLIEASTEAGMFGLPINAILVREYLTPTTAFIVDSWGRLPIGRERRFFVKDGKVICKHAYWPEDALRHARIGSLELSWKQLLADRNEFKPDERDTVDRMAADVANIFTEEGSWSVDFMEAVRRHPSDSSKDEYRWFLIDMATAKDSWHPEECEFNEQPKRSQQEVG